MRVHRWWSIVAIIPGAVFAADPPPEGVWTGKGQAGYVASQGNTEAESANAALDMTLISNKWKHLFHLGGLYGKSAGILSAERWDSGWQSDYNFSADMFSFGALRYAHDMFSGFAYQATATAGMGYKFINTPTTQFSGQLGVGYRKARLESVNRDSTTGIVTRVPIGTTGNAIVTAELDYAQQLTASTSLSNKLLVESGSSNTLITDSFALAVKMSDRLALSVGINVQDNTKPPVGLKKVDTTETVNLVYAF